LKKDKDKARKDKARAQDVTLAAGSSSIDPKSKAELKKLTIPLLQGLLLHRAPGEWAENKKLKAKADLLSKLHMLYPGLPDETPLALPFVPDATEP
jgi:hypothetical protein